jgi:D-lactate dehydrogenase (cytochrome)
MAWARRVAAGAARAASAVAARPPRAAAVAAGAVAAAAGVAGCAGLPSPPPPPPAPSLPGRAAAVADLVAALVDALGPDAVVTDPDVLATYSRDAWSPHSGPPPDAVVHPRDTAGVAAAVRACAARRVPVIARGGGTSLEGHTVPVYRGVVIDTSALDGVVVRAGDMDATVGAGVRWEALNAALAGTGLTFPMDPGPGAAVGGMVGTGCSGTNAVRHGAMKANVLSLTVVLPDGAVVATGRRARKSAAGYDLTSLFVGSEGTLGIVTEATIRLAPVPEVTAVAVVPFPSVTAASAAVGDVVRAGVGVGAAELLDAPMMRAVNAASGFSYAPTPHLFFKLSGPAAKVDADAAAVASIAASRGAAAFTVATDPAAAARLWEARKVALWSAAAMDPARKIATTDVCVPVSRLPDLMAAGEAAAAASGLAVYAVAHAGDGNAHHFIAFSPTEPAEVAAAAALNAALVRAALAMDGTCTGEHGVGLGKQKYLAEEFGEGALDVMRAIKAAIDPAGIMNPGKKLPARGGGRAGAPAGAGAGAGAGAVHVGAAAGGPGALVRLGLLPACDCEAGHRRVVDDACQA